MSTTIPPPVETPKFDPKAIIEARNQREAALKAGQPAPEPKKPEAKAEEEPKVDEPKKPSPGQVSRSDRRALRIAYEEAGAAKERARLLEEQVAQLQGKSGEPAAKAADPEPVRKDYATDLEYQRAINRWDARQEAQKVTITQEQQRGFQEAEKAALAKSREDMELFDKSEWQELTEAIQEDDISFPEDGLFGRLFRTSQFQTPLLYWGSKHPERFKAVIEEKDTGTMIQNFRRIEGYAEHLLDGLKEKADNSKRKDNKAAQATEQTQEDRTHPAEEAEETPGRNGTATESRTKPRPSTEVAARGGTAPPDAPKPGTAAWIAMRNRKQYGPVS
jgi:hypothetical protein